MEDRNKAEILLVITAILWSTSGLLIKLIDWHPLAIAGMRSIIAGTVLMLIYRKFHWRWSASLLGGGISYAIAVIMFVTANKLTTAANVILIQYSAPIYIALFSRWFLNEDIIWIDWLTTGVVIWGLTLFFMDDLSISDFWGNILAMFSGIGLAWFFMFVRKIKNISTMEPIILGNLLTGVIGLPFMFQSSPDVGGWVALFIMGIFQLGLSYYLFSIAIKHVTAMEAILIPIIEPILNPIWVLLMVGEVPGKWTVVGGVIVIAAITIRGVLTNRKQVLIAK